MVPSIPGKPIKTAASLSGQTIDIKFAVASAAGGWAVTDYMLWVDDGAGNWPSVPTALPIGSLTIDSNKFANFQKTGLTGGKIYGFKVQAKNAIGTSGFSDSQFFPCADIPPTLAAGPILETATNSTITLSWNAPSTSGGVPISGYRVYMNELMQGDWKLIYDGKD